MLHILAPRHVHTLNDFAASNVLLAFDFDGTLAPIVPEPSAARMGSSTRRLLAAVARRYPCIVISGRARHDLLKRIGALPVFHVAGNHGLEPWGQSAAYASLVHDWVHQLAARLGGYDGLVIEDKTYSVAVHYRRAPSQRRAAAAIARAVRGLRGARTIGGRQTVNLVPRGAPHKGTALERARRLLACDTAIYVGDDDTDEDAFGSDRPDRLLAVRVGVRRQSRARYSLRNQAEIDDFLLTLLACRPRRNGKGR